MNSILNHLGEISYVYIHSRAKLCMLNNDWRLYNCQLDIDFDYEKEIKEIARLACEYGHINILRRFLSGKIVGYLMEQTFAFADVCLYGHNDIAELLLSISGKNHSGFIMDGFVKACEGDNIDMIKLLIERGFYTREGINGCFHSGNLKTAKWLINSIGNGKYVVGSLREAVISKSMPCITYALELLYANNSEEFKIGEIYSAIKVASSDQWLECIKLLDPGTECNCYDILSYGIGYDNMDMIEYVNGRVEINNQNLKLLGCLAIESNSPRMINYVISLGYTDLEKLFDFCFYNGGYMVALKYILTDLGFTPQSAHIEKIIETLIFGKYNLDMIKILYKLDNSICQNEKLFIYTCGLGYNDIIKFLIKVGKMGSKKINNGLINAVKCRQYETAKLLLRCGASAYGKALYIAVKHSESNPDCVKFIYLLRSYGANNIRQCLMCKNISATAMNALID